MTHLTYLKGNIHSIQSSLNEDLLNINRWLITNKLMLHMTNWIQIKQLKAKA